MQQLTVYLSSILFLPVLLLQTSSAAPDLELVYKLKTSIVKVHALTQGGAHGVGSGVVVAPDVVATNCHVLANASGVNISKFGDSITPVAMYADWVHDVCLLTFQYLDLPPVKLSTTNNLHYGQEVFSIGFPGGLPKPLTTVGKIRALYPYAEDLVIRTDAAFIMGASGSPLFNNAGELIGINTFKSPGKFAYYYSVPVEWVQKLLKNHTANIAVTNAFWDQPTQQQPFFMQVTQPYLHSEWNDLHNIAEAWIAQTPELAEAYFYLASALHGQGKLAEARSAYEQTTALQPAHIEAWQGLAVLAEQSGQSALFEKSMRQLNALDEEAYKAMKSRLSTTARPSNATGESETGH
ncbi:S1 family peptidase [Methylophilus aquaticus]|uniref:Trypsin-like peptidase domain-containing protein n=1 Tax=Methylophilus aquaticus TaxID=1971610 RepID=A0ABT9JPG1_9PROT|nr:serine protease [Methylophilus aquaticus]MDP8566466.1 trypsin-like peptidase domain-containing protein [Methylophilus aquaticus]